MPTVWGTTSHVKIANGQTTSGELDCRGMILEAIQLPAAFTGTTLSFVQAEVPAKEGGVFSNNVKYLNTLAATTFTITGLVANDCVYFNGTTLPDGLMNGIIKIVSGSAEGADRDLICYLRPM